MMNCKKSLNRFQMTSTSSALVREKKCAWWLISMAAGAAVSAHAQVGGLVGQSENVNTRQQLNQTAAQMAGTNTVPQLYEGETSDVGPQSVVTPVERRTLFQARADMQFLYTDNAFLTARNKVDTGIMISTAEFALAPTPYPLGGGTLAPEIGYQGQFFDYFFNKSVPFIGTTSQGFPTPTINDYDFNTQSVFGDATWTCGHLGFGSGLEATRMFNTAHFDPFYDELSPFWSVRYVLPLGEKSALSASYLGDYRFTSVKPNRALGTPGGGIDNRMDHGLLVTWSQVLTKQLVFQPFYEFKYTQFSHEQDTGIFRTTPPFGDIFATRNDYLNTAGVGLYWFVCPNCTVRGFFNYNSLKSSIAAAEYREWDGGGGIDVSIRF